MKILHVASFRGNIGDNANHKGFRPWFEELLAKQADWQEFEIRDVYRKMQAFDASFADLANDADIVVIGGGNYFELWVENSPTGTSISIGDDVLRNIRTPILFNALGVDDAQGYTQVTIDRFNSFMGRLLASDQFLVSVRNDGAYATLKRHVGGLPLDKVLCLPDGGFFADYSLNPSARVGSAQRAWRPRIGVNLAGDMLERRFPGGDGAHTYASFLAEMADAIARIWRDWPEAQFIFFPHIFRDLNIYADVLGLLPDQLRRNQVAVSAYDSGPAAAQSAFAGYAKCDVVLAMRFHANVVPIGNGVPTVGLFCYDQVKRLYDELGFPECVVDVSRLNFGVPLLEQVSEMLNNPDAAKARTFAMKNFVTVQRAQVGERIAEWLSRQAFLR